MGPGLQSPGAAAALKGVGRDWRGLLGAKLRGRPGLKCVQGRAPAGAAVKMEETKTLEAEVRGQRPR